MMVAKGDIIFGVDETTQPRQKARLKLETVKQLTSVLSNAIKGKAELDSLALSFPYCHPASFYETLISASSQGEVELFVLDYFAGSGTTAHAVMNLNREDQGERKFILVEMGGHFNTVLKPRVAKVIYSPDWKDGQAQSHDKGLSSLVKVLRLESYEDTLNNLQLTRTTGQQALLEASPRVAEQYTLNYLLDVETQGSPSLLSVDAFADPFNYTLNIATGTVGETKPTRVDLVETFNWLLGLRVKTIDTIKGVRVVTGTSPQGEKVLILWRNVKQMPSTKLDEFFQKQGYNAKDMEFDVIYINGDNNIENLKKDEQTWKVRLIEEDFKRLMFDVQDV